MNATGRIPTATYRLQLNKVFTFRDAPAIVPYTCVELVKPGTSCYHNIFTGECYPIDNQNARHSLPAANLFRYFPVALLLGDNGEARQGVCA